MILYHFTSREAVESIMAERLNRGEAPINDHRVEKAVNLTTDKSPKGHGLDLGGHVVIEEESKAYSANRFDIPAGTVFVEKRAVRITLKLPSSNPRLTTWRSWSRKHCKDGYAERLEKAAETCRSKAKTWWLYFGTIPPSAFLNIEFLDVQTGQG
ncbi:hypothetical protein [Sphingomonas sp. R86521]|uniref:hypothetical protein n=1 Tax=Sphingomonas sp. R86521 TaxID=3093860 RepID=UPI0036D21308